jgi:hypothetical protein
MGGLDPEPASLGCLGRSPQRLCIENRLEVEIPLASGTESADWLKEKLALVGLPPLQIHTRSADINRANIDHPLFAHLAE